MHLRKSDIHCVFAVLCMCLVIHFVGNSCETQYLNKERLLGPGGKQGALQSFSC